MYIGDEGASILAGFLRQNTHIRTLLLDGNKITPSGFAAIFSSLSLNSSLTEISARFNSLGNGDTSGLAALYEFVRPFFYPCNFLGKKLYQLENS
jgi:hypothetical protein